MISMYGLKNCDTCKRVIKDLKNANIEFNFSDFRRDGLEFSKIAKWQQLLGYLTLINKRGTTWRDLNQSDKEYLTGKKAIALMFNNPALIKRPVFEIGDKVIVGYKEEQKKALGL